MANVPEGLVHEPAFVPAKHALEQGQDCMCECCCIRALDKRKWLRGENFKKGRQHYGARYIEHSGQIALDDVEPWGGPVAHFRELLSKRFGCDFDQAIVTEYLSGDGIGLHKDHTTWFGPTIASVSFGDTMTMDFVGPGGQTYSQDLKSGDMMAISGPARTHWKHKIQPVRGRAKHFRRISITFRMLTSAAKLNLEGQQQKRL